MNDVKLFSMCMDIYFSTRKNKRYGRDQMDFESDWVSRFMAFYRGIRDKSLRINHNYAFLVSRPKWREVFATSFDGRMADHLLCDALIPYIEKTLPERTYNNRKGKGSKAAINQVIDDIAEVSCGYTRPARIIKWDISGFFPSARWEIIQKCFDDVIDEYKDEIDAIYGDGMAELLHWLALVCINCSPANHCELRTPSAFWREHIDREKSMFTKVDGIGAPIGRLTSQHGMGLYMGDIIKWLNDDCGIRTTLFVDDATMVVPEHLHEYALSLMRLLRDRMKAKGLCLNEGKFYDQPYQNGLELLGRHIRPNRHHLNNKIYMDAIERIDEFNRMDEKTRVEELNNIISSINSYTGMLKSGNDYHRMMSPYNSIDNKWKRLISWNAQRLCVNATDGFKYKRLVDRKYRLRLKFKTSKRYTKILLTN